MQPPRVGERRAVLECKVIDIVQFKNVWGQKVNGGLLPGDVVAVRVDNLLLKDGVDQTVAAHPGGQSKIGHYRLESGAIQQMVRSFSATVAARLLLYRPTGVLPAILDHKAPAVRMAQVKRTRAAGSAR